MLPAVNCIPPADVTDNWLTATWGSTSGVPNAMPGNNSGADDAVYIRRNNTIIIDSDVSPSALGYTGGLGRLDVGDGIDGPSLGSGTLLLTGNGRLRVERANRTLVNVSVVNPGRNRPNSVGSVLMEGQAELIGSTLNVGATTVAYDTTYLSTHTVPSSGHLRLADQATATFATLVLGTTTTLNASNSALGFPPTSGLLELVGSGTALTISGSSSFNSSGTLRLTATAGAIPHPAFSGATATETGFTLHIALEDYDLAGVAAGSSPLTVSVLSLASEAAASAFLSTATVSITGHDPEEVSAAVTASGSTIRLTLTPNQVLPPTGTGVRVSHQPSPSTFDILLGRDIYIADPSIVIAPDGSYLIAHSIFGPGTDQANLITKVFRSIDRGATWTQVTTMTRLQRANFFVHDGVVYCLGTGRVDDTTTTQLVIRKSTDNGLTWTPGPTVTGDAGWIRSGGTGTPSTPVCHDGRIWMARATLGLSGDLAQDLMAPSAWSVNNNPQSLPHGDPRPAYRDAWPAYNDQTYALWSESQIVASPQTGVVLMPKVELQPVARGDNSVPHFAHISHISLQTVPSHTSAVQIDPATTFVPLPGTEKKFGATYDPVTQRFYAITNTVLPAFATHEDAKHIGYYKPQLTRNTGTLYSSADLVDWNLEKIFIHSDNVARQAWQYFNFVFDGEHIIIASRTAFRTEQDSNNPPRGHDSNLLTFHRIPNYRDLTVVHTLTITDGTVLRAEPTDYQPAPLGRFALGEQPVQPVALAEAPDGTILIRQQDGQILRHDAHGNFLGTVAQAPDGVALVAGPIAVVQQRSPQRTWTQSGGGAWYDPRNWHYYGIPDTSREVAMLGSAATAPASLAIDRPTALNGLVFRAESPYHLAEGNITATNGTLYHTGSISLVAHPESAAAPHLQVAQGRHTVALPLNLEDGSLIDLAAETSLELAATVTLAGSVTATIDLGGQDPALPTLDISHLSRSSGSGGLTLRLANIPHAASPITVARFQQLTGLTEADLSVTTADGTPLPFSLDGDVLAVDSPVLPVSLVDEFASPADTHSLRWFGSGAGHLDRTAPPGITIMGVATEGGSNSGLRHAVAHFADPRKPFVLEAGQSVTLSARITPIRTTSLAASNALRFGLFNTRNRAEDFLVADNNAGNNLSTGYMIGLNTSNTAAGSLVAYSRSPDVHAAQGNTYALIVHSTAFQNRGSSASLASGKLTQGQTYTIRLTLTRTDADTIAIAGAISGGDLAAPATVTATDTPATNRDGLICTEFDTIAFAAANNAGIADLRITDISLTVPPADGAPAVLLHPWDQALPHLSTLKLSTVATGAPPLSFQWQLDGTDIPGADGPLLTVEEATALNHSGLYTCTIRNALGEVTTEAAIVEISPAPLASQVFIHEFPDGTGEHHLTWWGSAADVPGIAANALQLRGNLANGLGSPTGLRHILTHFADTDHPVILENGQSITVSLNLTPTITTALTSSNAFRLALLNTFGRSENIIASHSNPAGVSAAGYGIFFHSNTGGLAHAARRFIPPPADDDGPFFLSSIYLNFSYPYQTLATESGLIPGNTLQQGQTYRLTHVLTRVSDTTLTITSTFSGGHLPAPVALSTTETATANNRDGFIITEFDTLAIASSGNGGLDTIEISDLQIIIPEQPGTPHIHVQPVHQRILAGQPATLYTNATGQLPLNYQWYRDGILIPDATGQTYALAAASEADASDAYTCVITNPAGSSTTQPVQIAIRTPETIVAPTPASYLASRMVLQRDKPNTIWGIANANDPISVTLVNTDTGATAASASTVADAQGHFLTTLPPLPFSTSPHNLVLSNPLDTTTLTDILIGEVWLCGGQSNMAWSVNTANNAGNEVADSVNYPLIRVYKSTLSGSVIPRENNSGTWHPGTPATIRNTTAVGTFFARTLAQTALQGIPIGILDVARGGSAAEAWFERETLRQLGYTAYADSSGDGNTSGAALYNAMIHPIRHASLAGIIWYQGEANASSYERALEYRELFPQLIDHWRDDVFRQPDIPFNFVLLANFLRMVDATGEGWAWTRHAQLHALSRPNTAFAAAHDIGDIFDIHPTNKQDVGLRLGLNALRRHYGYLHLLDTGPRAVAASSMPDSGSVAVTFIHAQDLVLDPARRTIIAPDPDRNLPDGFTGPDFQLAGADGVWHAAEATVESAEGFQAVLHVSAAAVPDPRQVRYAWHNAPSSILFSTATHPITGAPHLLPATPFLLDVDAIDPATLTPEELLSYAFGEVIQPRPDPAFLPRLELDAGGSATLTFNRLRSSLNYLVEVSTDLAEWSLLITNPGSAGGPVTVAIPTSPAPTIFVRLRIILP